MKFLLVMPLQVLSCYIKTFLSLGLESSISRNARNFLSVECFYFLEYKKFFKVFASWNKTDFFEISTSQNIRKAFFWEKARARKFHSVKYKTIFNLRVRQFHFLKYKEFFNLGARRFHFMKYKKIFGVDFFHFFELRLIYALGSYFCKTFHRWCLTALNMPRVLHIPGFWICF